MWIRVTDQHAARRKYGPTILDMPRHHHGPVLMLPLLAREGKTGIFSTKYLMLEAPVSVSPDQAG